jgi:hypothetical protein
MFLAQGSVSTIVVAILYGLFGGFATAAYIDLKGSPMLTPSPMPIPESVTSLQLLRPTEALQFVSARAPN